VYFKAVVEGRFTWNMFCYLAALRSGTKRNFLPGVKVLLLVARDDVRLACSHHLPGSVEFTDQSCVLVHAQDVLAILELAANAK
jgi:hypothetical protein